MTHPDALAKIIHNNPGTRSAEIAQFVLDYGMRFSDFVDWTVAERILGFPITCEQFHTIDGAVYAELSEYEDDPDARLLFLGALMRHDYNMIQANSFTQFEIFGKPALFSDSRSQISSTPLGIFALYSYDLRHGDDDSFPCTLEHEVTVNWYGRVYTLEPLLDEAEKSRPVSDDDWSFSDEEDLSPLQFIERYKKEK